MKTFLEIGCADFDTLLPLAARGWCGHMVEPISEHCESLRRQAQRVNICGDQLKIHQCAISSNTGTIDMLVSSGTDEWTRGISHVVGESSELLNRPQNRKYKGKTITVECFSLDHFLTKIGDPHIDFLKLDVEGHELAILREYSWKIKPSFIKVEHKHLDDRILKKLLQHQGYLAYTEKQDIYAIY